MVSSDDLQQPELVVLSALAFPAPRIAQVSSVPTLGLRRHARVGNPRL